MIKTSSILTPYEINVDGTIVGYKATERAANMAMNRAMKNGAKTAGWELIKF